MTAQRRGRNGHAGRRKQKPAPQRQVVQSDSEEESSDGASVTRCVCGESHNVGLMVQCDQCEVWQHCDCVGLEEQDIPEHYYCEECKPENHSVVKLTHGRVRRSYSSDGRFATSTTVTEKKPPKRRMTFNSREALMSLEDVLAARNALEFGAYTSSPPSSPKVAADEESKSEDKDKDSPPSSDKEEKKKSSSSDANDMTGSNKEDDDAMEVEVETSRPRGGKKPKRTNSRNSKQQSENDVGPNTKPARVEKRGGRGGARRTNSTGSRRGQNSRPRSRTSTPQPGEQSPANNSISSSSIFEKLSTSAREASPPARIRYPSAKMSISEMNRRAKQILEYISSIQVEMATSSNSPSMGNNGNGNFSATPITTSVKQEQITAQQRDSRIQIDPLTKVDQVSTTVVVEQQQLQDRNGAKPAAIVIPEKREDGPSSSLSSASTIPLEENPSGQTASEEHLHKEKSTAEEAIAARSMQEQESKREQTSLEIMDMLSRELINFQRKFGSKSTYHGSSRHHRSSNKEEDSESETTTTTTTRVTRSRETSGGSGSSNSAAAAAASLLVEKSAAHA